MTLSSWQVPVIGEPLVTVFNVHVRGDLFSAQLRLADLYYSAFVVRNGSTISLAGLYPESGIPVQTNPVTCTVAFAPPIPDGPKPLRIPECAAPTWDWFAQFCNINNTNATFHDACQGASFLRPEYGYITTPSGDCVKFAHQYLTQVDAANSKIALIVITAIAAGFTALLTPPPFGVLTGILGLLIYSSYDQLYSTDKNPDGSFDLYLPLDWTDFFGAFSGIGYYAATPHYWWFLFMSAAAVEKGPR